MTEEREVWCGGPSQVVNLVTFLVCGLLCWLVFPLLIMLWKWLVVKNIRYELTTERLRTCYGVLNKTTDELELYRVRDYQWDQPFFLRLFSLGNVILVTSDRSHPQVVLQAVPDGDLLCNQLRACVEARRASKGVREVDIE